MSRLFTRQMTKSEVQKLIIESKATSPSTRSFVTWLYENGYEVVKKSGVRPLSPDTQNMTDAHLLTLKANNDCIAAFKDSLIGGIDIMHNLSTKDAKS